MSFINKKYNTSKPVIALTFDDGPNTTTTLDVLEKLKKYNVVASFFVVGNNITEKTRDVIKQAFNMNCEICNHSKTHNNLTLASAEEIIEEIRFTDDLVKSITGVETKFFRPPYIAYNQVMFDNIDLPFICGYGSNDWDDNVSVQERSSKVLEQISDGSIILLHDMEGNKKTVDALDLLIPALLEKGYQFVTVSDLFIAKGISPNRNNYLYSNVLQSTPIV